MFFVWSPVFLVEYFPIVTTNYSPYYAVSLVRIKAANEYSSVGVRGGLALYSSPF